MGYTPENNPYIPGDPYSYDLKWLVEKVKRLDETVPYKSEIIEFVDQASESASSAAASVVEAQSAAARAESAAAQLDIPFITPEMYGAKGDGVTDDTQAFIDAIATERPIELMPNKTYKIDGVVTADVFFVGINGNHSVIEGGQFVLNVENGQWTKPYSQPYSYIKNVRFYNTAETPNLTCIQAGLPIDFERVVFNRYTVAFEKVGAYLDHVSMKNVIVYHPIGSDYRIKCSGLGDDSYFESCGFDGDKTFYGLSLNGALFINCLQGEYDIANSVVTFLNCHMEGNHGVNLLDDKASVHFESCTFWSSSILPANATYNNCKMICNPQTSSINITADAKKMKGNNITSSATTGIFGDCISELKMFDLKNCPDTSHYQSATCMINAAVSTSDYDNWKVDYGNYDYTFYPSTVPFGFEGGNMPVAKTIYSLNIPDRYSYVQFTPRDYVYGAYVHAYREHQGIIEHAVIPITKGRLMDYGAHINGYKWETVSAIPTPAASGALFKLGSYFESATQPNTPGYIWMDTTNNVITIS